MQELIENVIFRARETEITNILDNSTVTFQIATFQINRSQFCDSIRVIFIYNKERARQRERDRYQSRLNDSAEMCLTLSRVQ
jgi:hypothetical protein